MKKIFRRFISNIVHELYDGLQYIENSTFHYWILITTLHCRTFFEIIILTIVHYLYRWLKFILFLDIPQNYNFEKCSTIFWKFKNELSTLYCRTVFEVIVLTIFIFISWSFTLIVIWMKMDPYAFDWLWTDMRSDLKDGWVVWKVSFWMKLSYYIKIHSWHEIVPQLMPNPIIIFDSVN